MRLLKAVGVLGWLSASGALAQEAPPSEPAASEAPAPSEQPVSVRMQYGGQLVYGLGDDVQGAEGLGVRLQLLARFNDYVASGVELSFFFAAGTSTTFFPRPGGGGEDSRSSRTPLPMFTLPVRIGLDRGDLRPAAVLGMVGMAHEFYGGLGLVGGLELAIATGPVPVVLDARYYHRLSGSSQGFPVIFSLGLGTRF